MDYFLNILKKEHYLISLKKRNLIKINNYPNLKHNKKITNPKLMSQNQITLMYLMQKISKKLNKFY